MISDKFLNRLFLIGMWLCLSVGALLVAIAALLVPLGYRFSDQFVGDIILAKPKSLAVCGG
jgi:cell division protein FtsX